jgi:small multidrug resistance pump
MQSKSPSLSPTSSARTLKLSRIILQLAAAYNILWGAWVILWPLALFQWAELPLPNYPEIWQCVGMIVGVYGLGYFWASFQPMLHWPIIAVGLLGKILGPLGFIKAIYTGVFNWSFAIVIVFNDLIWWWPFSWILYQAYLCRVEPRTMERGLATSQEP